MQQEIANIIQALEAIEADGNDLSAALDESVQDAALAAASTINNQGIGGQIEYLVQELGIEAAVKEVQQGLGDEASAFLNAVQAGQGNECPVAQIEEAYRNVAREEGENEVDARAIVSLSADGGAYVQSWLWVDIESLPASLRDTARGLA